MRREPTRRIFWAVRRNGEAFYRAPPVLNERVARQAFHPWRMAAVLYDAYLSVRGDRVVDVWPIDAGG